MCGQATGDRSWQGYITSRREELVPGRGRAASTRSGEGRSACCCGAAFHNSLHASAMIAAQRASEIGTALTRPT